MNQWISDTPTDLTEVNIKEEYIKNRQKVWNNYGYSKIFKKKNNVEESSPSKKGNIEVLGW